MVPVQGIGIEGAKPILLNGPEARTAPHDLNIVIEPVEEWIGLRAPGGAAGDFAKSQVLVKFDCPGVVITHVEPERRRFFVAGLFHHAFGKGTPNPASTVIGMCCRVRDEINAFALVSKRDQAGIADDASILLPYVTRERQGRGFRHVRSPAQEAIVPDRKSTRLNSSHGYNS